MPVNEPTRELYAVLLSLVPEFKEVISPCESRTTVDLVAACAETIAPAERLAASNVVVAAAATTRNASFLFILIFLLFMKAMIRITNLSY
jgi:hypothetical protein